MFKKTALLLSLLVSGSAFAQTATPLPVFQGMSKFQESFRALLECRGNTPALGKDVFLSSTFYSFNIVSKVNEDWAVSATRANGVYPMVFGLQPKSMVFVHGFRNSSQDFVGATFADSLYRVEESLRKNVSGVSVENIETPKTKIGLVPFSNNVKYVKSTKDARTWLIAELNGSFTGGVMTTAVACVNRAEIDRSIQSMRGANFR